MSSLLKYLTTFITSRETLVTELYEDDLEHAEQTFWEAYDEFDQTIVRHSDELGGGRGDSTQNDGSGI